MNELVELCRKIATKAHTGQFRKFGDDRGKPYIIHPERVSRGTDNHLSECVALLHDVLEDTSLSRFDLEDLEVPARVIKAVESVTRNEGETYLDFILRAREDVIGREVKILDIET